MIRFLNRFGERLEAMHLFTKGLDATFFFLGKQVLHFIAALARHKLIYLPVRSAGHAGLQKARIPYSWFKNVVNCTDPTKINLMAAGTK